MIGLSESTYYYNPKVCRKDRERVDADLRNKIEDFTVKLLVLGVSDIESPALASLRSSGEWKTHFEGYAQV